MKATSKTELTTKSPFAPFTRNLYTLRSRNTNGHSKTINVAQNISHGNIAKASKFPLPEIPLGADVGANAEVHVESGLLHQLDEVHQIIPPLEVVLRMGQPTTTSATNRRTAGE